MTDPDLEEVEVELVLEALRRRYGYDFGGYARASLLRRLKHYAAHRGEAFISNLIPPLLHDPQELDRLVNGISVTVTEPFRDPEALSAVREHVLPWLRSHPFSKIWVAGCSTGEEAYSLAILLLEADMLDRVQIYATDINTDSLARAKAGIYPLESLRRAESNYQRAGGERRLSEHYVEHYGRGKFSERLSKPIIWSQHNLATDAAFGEMHLVMCRNVLIYFQSSLQERVLALFRRSLAHRAYLQLGAKESLRMLESGRHFEAVDAKVRLFRAI